MYHYIFVFITQQFAALNWLFFDDCNVITSNLHWMVTVCKYDLLFSQGWYAVIGAISSIVCLQPPSTLIPGCVWSNVWVNSCDGQLWESSVCGCQLL
jgi:hypothetical protein